MPLPFKVNPKKPDEFFKNAKNHLLGVLNRVLSDDALATIPLSATKEKIIAYRQELNKPEDSSYRSFAYGVRYLIELLNSVNFSSISKPIKAALNEIREAIAAADNAPIRESWIKQAKFNVIGNDYSAVSKTAVNLVLPFFKELFPWVVIGEDFSIIIKVDNGRRLIVVDVAQLETVLEALVDNRNKLSLFLVTADYLLEKCKQAVKADKSLAFDAEAIFFTKITLEEIHEEIARKCKEPSFQRIYYREIGEELDTYYKCVMDFEIYIRAALVQARADLASTQAKLRSQEQKVSATENELKQVANERAEFKGAAEHVSRQLDDILGKYLAVESYYKETQANLEESQRELNESRRELDESRRELETTRAELETTKLNQTATVDVAALESRAEIAEEKLKASEGKNTRLEVESNQLKDKLEEVKAELARTQAHSQKLVLPDDHARATGERDQLKSELAKATVERDYLKSELERLRAELKEARADNQKLMADTFKASQEASYQQGRAEVLSSARQSHAGSAASSTVGSRQPSPTRQKPTAPAMFDDTFNKLCGGLREQRRNCIKALYNLFGSAQDDTIKLALMKLMRDLCSQYYDDLNKIITNYRQELPADLFVKIEKVAAEQRAEKLGAKDQAKINIYVKQVSTVLQNLNPALYALLVQADQSSSVTLDDELEKSFAHGAGGNSSQRP